jgi:hypothetical protein
MSNLRLKKKIKEMTLREQIANKCIFYTGLSNKVCNENIQYKDVMLDKPINLPCLNRGGFCARKILKTDEQVDIELKEMEGWSSKSLNALIKIKNHHKISKQMCGEIKCDCGGVLRFSIAEINNHIWGNCMNCGIAIRE